MNFLIKKLNDYGLALAYEGSLNKLNPDTLKVNTSQQYAAQFLKTFSSDYVPIIMIDSKKFTDSMNFNEKQCIFFRYFYHFYDMLIEPDAQTITLQIVLNRESMFEDVRQHLIKHVHLYPNLLKELTIKNIFSNSPPRDEDVEKLFDDIMDCFYTANFQDEYQKLYQELFTSIEQDFVSFNSSQAQLAL